MSTTLYGLDKCDTCRKARNWLDRAGIDYQFIDYREQRIAPELLKNWAAQLGGWEKLVNRASMTWRNLPPTRKTPGSDPEWLLLIKEYPALIKRPVLATTDAAISVGFTDKLFKQRLAIA